MELVLDVSLEKLAHRNPRVLSFDVVLIVVACEPLVKSVVLLEAFVVGIL